MLMITTAANDICSEQRDKLCPLYLSFYLFFNFNSTYAELLEK